MRGIGQRVAHAQQVPVGWRQILRRSSDEKTTDGGQSGDDGAAAGDEAVRLHDHSPTVMARSCRLNPDFTIITTWTPTNNSSATNVKK